MQESKTPLASPAFMMSMIIVLLIGLLTISIYTIPKIVKQDKILAIQIDRLNRQLELDTASSTAMTAQINNLNDGGPVASSTSFINAVYNAGAIIQQVVSQQQSNGK